MGRTASRIVAVVIILLAAAGCVTRRPAPALPSSGPPPRIDVPALIARGCYRCLEEAFAAASAQQQPALAFEAATLLALRSKELGLPSQEWQERARGLAASDSSLMYLDIVRAIAPDRLSGERESAFDIRERVQARASLTEWREMLREGEGSAALRAYLDLSLVCSFGRVNQNDDSFSGPLDPVAATPLYRYRLGVCDLMQRDRLAAFRAANAEFVDADFALGRFALEDPVAPDPDEGLRRLESAAAAFPRSPAIATTIGDTYRAWEEWAPALAAYDRAIVVSREHPEALLGRTISLSRLLRSQEAIETATRLIDLGQWRVGEAFYWRAWNYLLLGDYQTARRDADRARALMANAAVHVLSGTIEWRLRRLEPAEREFQQALTIDLGECEAAFDLGVVRDELGRQPGALAAFRQARQCYGLAVTLRREAIARIQSGPGSDATKLRGTALHERALKDLTERHEEARQAIELLERATSPR